MIDSSNPQRVPTPAEWSRLVREAYARIRSSIVETPLESAKEGFFGSPANLLLKREDLQHTGSFKLRGATNKILSLSSEQAAAGVVAASNGNHGLGVAEAARRAGIAAEVYVSSHVSPVKAQRIEQLGARICRSGSDPLEAELAARAAATKSGRVFISPYNDLEVMAGQGTIAVEIERQWPEPDAVFVAVGGGGLVGGIGTYLKYASPQTEIVGCWPANSPVLYESLRAGRILDVAEKPTLSESTAGGLEPGSITLGVCSRVIDRSVLVSEAEILAVMRRAREIEGRLMEGAAAVALAAFLKEPARYEGKTVVVVVCGGNVSPEVVSRMA
jgi:threonine dehydratase